MPAKPGSEHQAGRHAEDRGDGKGRHDHAHGGAAPVFGDDIADDRQNRRAGHAAKRAGDGARGYQKFVSGRQGTSERAGRETEIKENEARFAIKTVEEETSRNARDSRGDGVSGDDGVELRRRDMHDAHVLGAERQNNQEIQVCGKLDRGQQQQHQSFVLQFQSSSDLSPRQEK